MSTISVSEVKQLFEKLCPDQTLRLRSLSLFAEAIKHAHHYAPDAWVVLARANRKNTRLTVGHISPFGNGPAGVWLALDLRALEASPEAEMLLDDAQSWQWSPNPSGFKRIPYQSGRYSLGTDPSEKLLPILRN